MQNPGIVICSRLSSERLPGKAIRKINGVPIIVHLLRQVLKAELPVILAVPHSEYADYADILDGHVDLDEVDIYGGSAEDPLERMAKAQDYYGFSHVVRVTHDKIFVDVQKLFEVVQMFKNTEAPEYIYSSTLTPGTGFEIISAEALQKAAMQFKNVEHISYAVRAVSTKILNFESGRIPIPFNLLIDFPEDLSLMEVIFSKLGNETGLEAVRTYLRANEDLTHINHPPLVSVYICAYNAEKFIRKAMHSIPWQLGFEDFGEIILVDDHSTDATCELMAKFAAGRPNVTWYRNAENMGLASSSNIALKKARGKYIVRLDADDFFTSEHAISNLMEHASRTKDEAVYPDNYFGDFKIVQKGKENHHVGGALFDRNALNFIKFTDGLRNYEGLDLFVRAKDRLKIGYLEKPIFFYTQHAGSMSRTNMDEREEMRKRIMSTPHYDTVPQCPSEDEQWLNRSVGLTAGAEIVWQETLVTASEWARGRYQEIKEKTHVNHALTEISKSYGEDNEP